MLKISVMAPAVLALVLAGCAQANTSPAGSNSQAGGAPVHVASVGQTLTYPDGLAVSVTKIETREFDQGELDALAAQGDPSGEFAADVSVQFVNGTHSAVDLSTTDVGLAYGPDATPAVVGFADAVSDLFGVVLPTKSHSTPCEFVIDPAGLGAKHEVQVTITPAGYPSVVFTGTIS